MKIRYIVSMGGAIPIQANEKAKNGSYVWYDVDDYEAVRLIDAEIAVAQTESDYEKAKANHATLELKRVEAKEIAEVLENLDAMKEKSLKLKEDYKALAEEIKDLDLKIKKAEAIK